MAELAGVIADLRTLRSELEADPRNERTIAETVHLELHVSELRQAYELNTAALRARQVAVEAAYDAGRAAERARSARVPGPRPGRHASAGWRASPIMVRVKAIVPLAAAASWAALKVHARRAAGHHFIAALGAHPAASITGAVTVAALTAAVALPSSAPPPRTYGYAPSQIPAPAASDYADGPLSPLPVSGAPVTGHGRADADHAGQLPAAQPPPWYPLPSASPAASPTPTPTAGTLQLAGGGTVTELDLGADGITYTGTVTFTASGGDVKWGAVSSDSADLAVFPAAGALQDGRSATLTFTVSAAAQITGGTAVVHVYPGLAIRVAWAAAPVPSASASPPAVPTPSDTPSPSAS